MSAVRMVAYGVLELKSVGPVDSFLNDDQKHAEYKRKMFERDQLMKLVNDELRSHGLLLSPKVQFGTRHGSTYILHGSLLGGGYFPRRERMKEGSFKDCCIEAARLLDVAEATRTLLAGQSSSNPTRAQ